MTLALSGMVSGLNTSSIIDQLVSGEQAQQTQLQTEQSTIQTHHDTYASLVSALQTLAGQATDLANTSGWTGATATSSTSDVTATASGTSATSLTFDVTSVAQAHTLISADSVSSTSSQVASGALTLTKSDGTTASIDVGTGSLSDVVSAINNANDGITATAVQTGTGAYRLQVVSTSTGASSAFTLSGLDGFSGMNVLTQGSDATVHVGGTSTSGYDVNSTTNTFSSLVPGLSFTVSKVESGVTVASTVDGTAVANKVNTLVSSANSILSTIAADTAYNSSTKTGGALLGDSTAQNLESNILSIVSSLNAPGLSVTQDGALQFDQSAFLTAFKSNPTQVAQAFGYNSSFTAASGATSTAVSVSGSTATSRAGSYAIAVTSLPANEVWDLDSSGADISGSTIQLTRGSSSVSYTVPSGQSLSDTASAFNTASAAAKFGVTASVVNGGLQFSADNQGSAYAFTASLDGTQGTQVTAGADIAGTIDGQTATGVGNVLSLPSGTGGAVGLSVQVSTTAADLSATGGSLGTLSYTPGVAQSLVTLCNDATDSQTGTLTTAENNDTAQVQQYQDEIDDWTTRLSDYRAELTSKFSAMESSLSTLQAQESQLSSTFGTSSSTSSTTSLLNSLSSSSSSSS